MWASDSSIPAESSSPASPLTLDNGDVRHDPDRHFDAARARRPRRKQLDAGISTTLVGIGAATLVAMLLAQLYLRPIHVLRSGLTRLQQAANPASRSICRRTNSATSAPSSARSARSCQPIDRELAGQKASLESVVERLEDAVALFDPRGELLFANPDDARAAAARRHGGIDAPWRELVQTTHCDAPSHGPVRHGRPRGRGTATAASGC